MESESSEQGMLRNLMESLALLRVHKPEQRSETARAWAVSITEMEKVVAYFKVYVVDAGRDVAMDIYSEPH